MGRNDGKDETNVARIKSQEEEDCYCYRCSSCHSNPYQFIAFNGS